MQRSLVTVLAACALAGCGGGTPAVRHAPAAVATPGAPAKTASSTLTIAIPLPKGGASASRAPHFVSSGTASGGIAIGTNSQPQFITQAFDLSSTSPNCTSANGVRTCTITVDLPLGNDTIALYTYDGPLSGGKPSGHMLAMATVTTGIIEGKHNSVAMSLLGVPASVTITPARSSVASTGSAVTVAVTTTVYDAAGNEILGADPYSEPIALQANGTRGALAVSVNGNPSSGYLTRPGDAASISYAGRGGSGSYTISASIFYGNNQIGSAPFTITPGMRVAQQIFSNLAHADLVQRYDNRDVWITEPAAHKLASYAANGTFTEYAIASGKEPRHIVFTGNTGVFPGAGLPFVISEVPDVIGIVHSDATVSEHQTPTANSGVGQMIYDSPSFTTTFAETAAGNIAKSDASGNITEYPVGIAGSAPVGIARNPLNGFIWFTDPGTNAIGLMRGDHSVTEYPIPTASAGPNVIVAADSNNTWFTEDNAAKLGHIDNATGAVVEYAAPGVIAALVPGASDGYASLWAVLRNGNVEQFDASSHTFTQTPGTLPANGFTVAAAAIGTSDNLWIVRSGVSMSELDELIY